MLKYFVFVPSFICSITLNAQTRAFTGDWVGKLNVGVELRMVFHVTKNSSGTYTGSLDSPDQGVKGIPASSVVVAGDSLIIGVDAAKGKFEGRMVNDSTIVGSWSQGPGKFPLTMVRMTAAIALNRPQTPKPPFSYKSEDVEYNNANHSVHFGGTLTYPATGGRFPVAILLSGSGQQDRDETLFEHKPFAVIADYLTKQGFAVLRVDDRGVGKTTGDVVTASTADFAKDVEAGIAYLKSRVEIDTSRIGLIGHSEGGLIAELVASKRKDINFIVLLAGPGVKGADLMAEQNRVILESQGFDAATAQSYSSFYRQMINSGLAAQDTTTAYKKAWAAYKIWEKATPLLTRTMLGFGDSTSARKVITSLVQQTFLPWMHYFMLADPAPLLAKTTAKVLALNGDKDLQVVAAANIAGIGSALKKSKSKVYTTKILPGLNHLFQKCNRCTLNEYGMLEETFSPVALAFMGDWLQANVQSK